MQLTIVVARACNIFPLTLLANSCRKPRKRIPLRYQLMMWFAGLRGAIAFALAMSNAFTTESQIVLTTTLSIIMVTVFLCGSTTLVVMEKLKIHIGVHDDDDDDDNTTANADADAATAGAAAVTPAAEQRIAKAGDSKLAQGWRRFDEKWLKPFFRADYLHTESFMESFRTRKVRRSARVRRWRTHRH